MSDNLKQDVFLLVAAVFTSLLVGAAAFSYIEGWSFFHSLYFVTMTATTVGYGDFVPHTSLGKFITILFSLSIIPFVLYTFSFVAKAQMSGVYKKIHHIERQQKEQEEEIEAAERKLNRQKAKIKEQELILKKEKKEIAAQKKKLEQEAQINDIQSVELIKQDEALDNVEDMVEDALKSEER